MVARVSSASRHAPWSVLSRRSRQANMFDMRSALAQMSLCSVCSELCNQGTPLHIDTRAPHSHVGASGHRRSAPQIIVALTPRDLPAADACPRIGGGDILIACCFWRLRRSPAWFSPTGCYDAPPSVGAWGWSVHAPLRETEACACAMLLGRSSPVDGQPVCCGGRAAGYAILPSWTTRTSGWCRCRG